MRIVGGIFRGRRLASFRGLSIRPTGDMVREAVFNVLSPGFHDRFRRVLDLFAGTGAMGIEALSRGSAEAVFVDSDPKSAAIIGKNLAALGIEGAEVLKADAIKAIADFARSGERFDLIFIDPPYESALTLEALTAIGGRGILNPGGVVVAETSRRNPATPAPPGLKPLAEKRYGDTVVRFYTTPDVC